MYKATILTSLVTLAALVGCLGPLPTPERTRGPSPTLDATTLAKIPTATTATTPSVPLLVITISPIPPGIPEYDRTQWPHWTDPDGDCRNARQETLAAESVVPVTFETPAECRVASGEWRDPYTGIHEDDPRTVDIDHLVPLENAHNSGGWRWPADRKREYANYLGDAEHLIAVTMSGNRSKGERGPEEWRPPDGTYWCRYALDWTEIKGRWDLTMIEAEVEAVEQMLDTCENSPEVEVRAARVPKEATPEPESTEMSALPPGTSTNPSTTATPTPAPDVDALALYDDNGNGRITCAEARAHGIAPVHRGHPAYEYMRDADGDGVVCE